MANVFTKLPGAPQRLWHREAEGKNGVWFQVWEQVTNGKYSIWFARWKGTTLLSTTCLNDSVPHLEMPTISTKGDLVRVVVEQTHQPGNAMPLFMAVSYDGGVTWQKGQG